MRWAVLLHLGRNMWGDLRAQKEMHFDRDLWNKAVDKCAECGVDTIILDVGEGVRYKSHPEIGIPGSWEPEEITAEVKRLRGMGIALVPKLNFSTVHDAWLGIYERMVSTPIYYQVCKDLIEEAYEMFDHPEFIHIGMDEETPRHADDKDYSYVALRLGDLWIKDCNYLIDCVKATGAKCHMWQSTFVHNEAAYDAIPNDVVVGSSHYYAHNKEKWHKISEQSEWEREYYATRFPQRYGYTIDYIEEDPVLETKMKGRKKLFEKGFPVAIVTTNIFIKDNEIDEAEHIKATYSQAEIDNLDGFVACPWRFMDPEWEDAIIEQIELLGKAKEYFYSDKK